MRSSFAHLLKFLLFVLPLINAHKLHPSSPSCRPIQKRQLVSSGEGGATNGPLSTPQSAGYTCDPNSCKLPSCQCASTSPPGGLNPKDVPQFIIFTADDSICQDSGPGPNGPGTAPKLHNMEADNPKPSSPLLLTHSTNRNKNMDRVNNQNGQVDTTLPSDSNQPSQQPSALTASPKLPTSLSPLHTLAQPKHFLTKTQNNQSNALNKPSHTNSLNIHLPIPLSLTSFFFPYHRQLATTSYRILALLGLSSFSYSSLSFILSKPSPRLPTTALKSYTINSVNQFFAQRKNPNGCAPKMTYFVSLNYTNYLMVTDWYVAGNEIADHTMTHVGSAPVNEIDGKIIALNSLSGIPISAIQGFRAPYL
ncbi:hypothetical protein PTTG_10998, partial [Puccinia triticina 1-1 BBBD Race 1]